MTRILFWLALLILVLLALRSKVKSMRARTGTGTRGQATPTLPPAEAMCCCSHCGIHFPASEAIRANDREYCSPAHARLPEP